MTCLCKNRFRNPIQRKDRTPFDKYTIQAGCGTCAGCNKRKQNDWLVRAYFEYMSKPTIAFFVSLDFDEQHIPQYNGMNCFDSELMSSFFETLRRVLPPFRYLYSSHLGEALQRPHYHVMFFFDAGSIDWLTFFEAIQKYWKYGNHTDVSKMRSVRDNPLSGVEYCTKYTTRDRKAALYFKIHNFPKKNRPRTFASVGFGAQCMDPKEFNSDRLIKQGVIFNETPTITRNFILNNSLVYLDIKKDGVLVPFAIPRYYELKLMYDYKYLSDEKKVDLRKNEYGKELQKIRHNANYINLYTEFRNSRTLKIHEDKYTSLIYQHVFPDSPYNGVQWQDVVNDVMQDDEKFWDFCKVYSLLEFDMKGYAYERYRPLRFSSKQINPLPGRLSGYYYHAASGDPDPYHPVLDEFFGSEIDCYIYAVSYYLIWKDVHNHRLAEFEDWKAAENTKVKIKQRCRDDVSYYWHLRRKGFKFYKLNPQPYVSSYQIRADCV